MNGVCTFDSNISNDLILIIGINSVTLIDSLKIKKEKNFELTLKWNA